MRCLCRNMMKLNVCCIKCWISVKYIGDNFQNSCGCRLVTGIAVTFIIRDLLEEGLIRFTDSRTKKVSGRTGILGYKMSS